MSLAQANTEQVTQKDKAVMEWSKNQLLRLEESLAAMEKQIGSTHPHVSPLSGISFLMSVAYLACEQTCRRGLHAVRSMGYHFGKPGELC